MTASAGRSNASTERAARLLALAEPILMSAPPDDPLRQALEPIFGALAETVGLPNLDGDIRGLLAPAQVELMDRLAESGAQPFDDMDERQAAIFLRGLPFDMPEVVASTDATVREWMPRANGRPKVFLVRSFHACGIVKGAIAAQWRR